MSLSLEDGKSLRLCPLILLSLLGNVPIICLDSVRPFGWMHSGREGKEESSGQWRQRAQEQKWKVHSMLRGPGTGWCGWSIWSIGHLGKGREKSCQGHGLKKHPRGFRFAWKRIFLQSV